MSLILGIGTFYDEFGSKIFTNLCSTRLLTILMSKIMHNQATLVLDIQKLSSISQVTSILMIIQCAISKLFIIFHGTISRY